jgi:activator of 2-hydroxyglutaryl-CoA dehydratase
MYLIKEKRQNQICGNKTEAKKQTTFRTKNWYYMTNNVNNNGKSPLYIGFDVGSTTVKAVVMDIDNDKIL